MYGGFAETWMKDVLPENTRTEKLAIISAIESEIERAALHVWDRDLLGIATKLKASRRKKDVEKSDKQKRASCLALYLQTVENDCLMAIRECLERHERSADINLFDGALVRKKDDNELTMPGDIMRACEAFVLEKTGQEIRLAQKPIETSFNFSESDQEKWVRVSEINDRDASYAFIRAMGEGRVVFDRKALYVFDERTGMFSSDESLILELIMVRHADSLRFECVNADGSVKRKDYGRNLNNAKTLKNGLEPLCRNTGFFDDNIETSLGKLLFADGIYDFESDMFTEGFDNKIVFSERITRPYPRERDELMYQRVNKLLFEDPFLGANHNAATYEKKAFAAALAGEYELKNVYFCLGQTNSSKGLTQLAFSQAFQGFVGEFDIQNLMIRSNTDDPAKANGFILPFCNKRIVFSSEATMENSIDGNILKSLFSGGDPMQARYMKKDAITIVNRATAFVMANDLPNVKPFDGGVQDRMKILEFQAQFVENPTLSHHRQADPEVKTFFKKDDGAKDALFHIMRDAYKERREHGMVVPPECLQAFKDYAEDENSLRAILEMKYTITGNVSAYVDDDGNEQPHGDYVSCAELEAFFKRQKVGLGKKARARELEALGLVNKKPNGKCIQIKVFGTVKTVWLGLKPNAPEITDFIS
jgi:hypothetical protein